MSIPKIALRPPVLMPPKRERTDAPNRCRSCGHIITETGECQGCSD